MSKEWKPKSVKDVYCSPACGRGCKRKEFDKATKEAAKLVRELGPDWTSKVWENLGWHYAAVSSCGRIKIHPFSFQGEVRSYTAFVDYDDSPGGRWTANGETPQEALSEVKKIVREELQLIIGSVSSLLSVF